ncbi:hypothetical protein NA655_13830 [Pseudomonas kuykendallii]|nr:hypothetical protein [Pseudomonas kuykendallii]MCQ4272103.1 hypothetical protein [Pseudomonas kuykendallii]
MSAANGRIRAIDEKGAPGARLFAVQVDEKPLRPAIRLLPCSKTGAQGIV